MALVTSQMYLAATSLPFAALKASAAQEDDVSTEASTDEMFAGAMEYKELGISEVVQSALRAVDMDEELVSPPDALSSLVRGRDVVCESPSLAARTLTSLLGAMQRVDGSRQCTQVIFLTATRSRLSQVWRQSRILAAACGISVQTLRPASSEDIQALKNQPQLLVGTAIAVREAISRRQLCSDDLRLVILDDAEKLCTGSLRSHLQSMLESAPAQVQLCALMGCPGASIEELRRELLPRRGEALPASTTSADEVLQVCPRIKTTTSTSNRRWCDMSDESPSADDGAFSFGSV